MRVDDRSTPAPRDARLVACFSEFPKPKPGFSTRASQGMRTPPSIAKTPEAVETAHSLQNGEDDEPIGHGG